MADKKPPKDTNELAAYILRVTTGETDKIEAPKKNPKFKALSDLGASKGGTSRKNALTPERRKEIAEKAAKSRWANKD